MNRNTLSLAAMAAVALAGLTQSQERATELAPQERPRPEKAPASEKSESRLRAVREKAPAALGKEDRVRLDSLVEQLGSPDFEERRDAAQKLRAEGEKIHGYLKRHMKATQDPELRWQLRRVLKAGEGETRRLRRESSEGQRVGPQRPGSGLRELESELTRMRREMDEMIRRMQSGNWPGRGLGVPHLRRDFGLDRDAMRQGEGTTVQILPGKVVVEVQTEENGKVQRERYEAKDMDELLRKHPELKGRVGGLRILRNGDPLLGSGPFDRRLFPHDMDFRFGPDFDERIRRQVHEHLRRLGLRGLPQQGEPGEPRDPRERSAPEPRREGEGTLRPEGRLRRIEPEPRPDAPRSLRDDAPREEGPKLGIYLRDSISAQLREYLGLSEGEGLWVESVAPSSLAEKLRIQRNDIVLELNGKKIGKASDVAAALRGHEGVHRAQVLRKGKKLDLRSEAPKSEDPEKSSEKSNEKK